MDFGLYGRYRESEKRLKRAADITDEQYPNAPYELALLHETGIGDDVFQDLDYFAQLYTKAADLGHAEAYFRMGEAYEHGLCNCPKDPGILLTRWTIIPALRSLVFVRNDGTVYFVRAPPILERNEAEAYAWALKAAEYNLPKAEYAVGYFTKMGIGCRSDALEGNARYVRGAEAGKERTIARLTIINDAVP